ncbi:MAG: hypothetical protein ABL871_03440 [Terricaulis sp.]
MDLPGVHKVWSRTAADMWVWRWYAWRGKGAPKIWEWRGAAKSEGQRAAVAAASAISAQFAIAIVPKANHNTSIVGGILDAWEVSEEFRAVSESTKRNRRSALKDMGQCAIAKMPSKLLAAKGAPRTIKAWRAQEAANRGPRAADFRVQILSRALNWAIGEGLASANPAAKMKPLHFSDRSDIIWEAADIEALIAAARELGDAPDYIAPEALALMGACYSGLSRQDLCALTWAQIGPHAITGKRLKAARRARTAGKKAKTIVIPRTPELDAVLSICASRAAEFEQKDSVKRIHVFLNSRGKAWTTEGLTSSFSKARNKGGPPDARGNPTAICDAEGRRKRLHDARGTFVTHMRVRMPDVTNAELAKMVGWEEEDVERVATHYVDAERIALAWLDRLAREAAARQNVEREVEVKGA